MIKKLLFIMLASVLVFSGCKKDEKAEKEITLNGTTWEASEKLSDTETASSTLKFSVTTFEAVTVFVTDGEPKTYTGSGTYEYKYPNLTMNDGERDLNGTVDEKTLTIKDDKGKSMVYTKR